MASYAKEILISDYDLEVARKFIPILVDWAKDFIGNYSDKPSDWNKTYSGLLNQAKKAYPDHPYLKQVTPITVGRRLGVIRLCRGDLPDLSCLVVSKATGECAEAYKKEYDPVQKRQELLELPTSYDWIEFESVYEDRMLSMLQISTRSRRIRDIATSQMFEHWKLNKQLYPKKIEDKREVIIKLIMEGLSAKEAFDHVMATENL
jgi:hypothetical protein